MTISNWSKYVIELCTNALCTKKGLCKDRTLLITLTLNIALQKYIALQNVFEQPITN